MVHLSITFPEELKRQLDCAAKSEHTKRSTLIQKAVRVYLQLKKRKKMMDVLKEGYEEMAGESARISEDFKQVDSESLKYVD